MFAFVVAVGVPYNCAPATTRSTSVTAVYFLEINPEENSKPVLVPALVIVMVLLKFVALLVISLVSVIAAFIVAIFLLFNC